MIEITQVTHSYRNHTHDVSVLVDVDLAIPSGQLLVILGPNGSGKTTLARLLNGLVIPDMGNVSIAGLDTSDPAHLEEIRSRVGMVFSNPDNQLIASSVEHDVAFALENRGVGRPEMRRRVAAALEQVGLSGVEGREPHRLSGGQKQLLALAGVLAAGPSCIVLDEATAMLDVAAKERVMGAVRLLNDEGLTVIHVTNEIDDAIHADRVVLLSEGRIILDGEPEEVLANDEVLKGAGLLSYGSDAGPGHKADGGHGSRGAEQSVISLSGVSYSYDGTGRATGRGRSRDGGRASTLTAELAIENLNIDFSSHEKVGLIGPAGSGKSTLLQHLNGLLAPSNGQLRLNGEEVTGPELRRHVGLIFQFCENQLFEETVIKDVMFGPLNMGCPPYEAREKAEWALEMVGLSPARFGERSPFSLSSGEMRRAAIAGVVAMRPRFIVLDEATCSLDRQGREALFALLNRLHSEEGAGIIMASHSVAEVHAFCDRVIRLDEGRLV